MNGALFWLRWSWRDLRQRAVLVTAIALVIALGTGTYAALLGSSAWRTQSNDESFALLNFHDVRLRLTQGTTAAQGSLIALVRALPDAQAVTGARERLVVATQLAGSDDLLAAGELVGTAPTGVGHDVDGRYRAAGRALGSDETGPTVVLERSFAQKNGLPSQGRLTVSGGAAVDYVGLAQSPEYFLVSSGQGAMPFLSQKSFGVLFATLPTAQRLAGLPGRVNDVVLTLRPGTDAEQVARELAAALPGATPAVSGTVTTREDIAAYRVLYNDIKGDEKLWRIIAILVLGGAALAALNLTSRIVEAQRREIGVGMALGVDRRRLAVRPLMFGAQVALFGVVLGVLVGWLVGFALRSVFTDLLPLPIWRTPLQLDVFAQAAALGFGLPFLAVLWPVWRAVRVEPVEAIRVGHLAARGGRMNPVLARVRLPGRSWRHIPLRNLLRTPRRSALTALAVAAAITTFVALFGLLDTFRSTLDRSQHELLRGSPQRITVALSDFQPVAGPVVTAIRDLPHVASATPGLLLTSTARSEGHTVDLVTELIGPDAAWVPSLTSGSLRGGLVLSEKAADDLHVRVGDSVRLEHPQAGADGRVHLAVTSMKVVGLHPNPVRVFSYVDAQTATAFNLTGLTNELTVVPAAGVDSTTVRRDLLAVAHVASAESVRATTDGMRSSLQEFMGILQVAGVVTLLLALLIAFNTASIGVDERAREHATMRAFGLPVRSVLGLTVVETALVGALGTVLGVAGGFGVLSWLTVATMPTVIPEIGVEAALSAQTVVAAVVLGIGVVAAAPLFTSRRLRRLDIPATLRVVE